MATMTVSILQPALLPMRCRGDFLIGDAETFLLFPRKILGGNVQYPTFTYSSATILPFLVVDFVDGSPNQSWPARSAPPRAGAARAGAATGYACTLHGERGAQAVSRPPAIRTALFPLFSRLCRREN